jgi:hypothetical protein
MGLERKSANWLRSVPLLEPHLPTARLPRCPTVGILRYFEEGFFNGINGITIQIYKNDCIGPRMPM